MWTIERKDRRPQLEHQGTELPEEELRKKDL